MESNAFKNIVISICGTFQGYKHGEIISIIEGLGTRYARTISHECTHLVTTLRQVRNMSPKVRKAYNVYTCEIVSLDWLLHSRDAKRPLSEEGYRRTGRETEHADAKALSSKRVNTKRALEGATEGALTHSRKRQRKAPDAASTSTELPAYNPSQASEGWTVYVDPSGTLWDALMVRSTSGAKSNHFYRQQLLVNPSRTQYISEAFWGRIGEKPASIGGTPTSLRRARNDFERRFRERTGTFWSFQDLGVPPPKKYRYIGPGEPSPHGSGPAQCSLPAAVQVVLARILNTASKKLRPGKGFAVYDSWKLPLGQLRKQVLREGYDVLEKLSELIETPSLAGSWYSTSFEVAAADLSSKYLCIIPHVFGRNQTPVFNCRKHVERELMLLDELANAALANEIVASSKGGMMHPLDLQYRALKLDEMTPLQRDSLEFRALDAYFKASTDNRLLKITNIFRIHRTGEAAQFQSHHGHRDPPSTRRLLWHGSHTLNFARILTEGLRIKPHGVKHHGSSLGSGVYFSDTAQFSTRYTSLSDTGSGFLLLCDVDLGFQGDGAKSDHGYLYAGGRRKISRVALRGSLIGTGTVIQARVQEWTSAGYIHPVLAETSIPRPGAWPAPTSEYVVFEAELVQLRYLVSVHRLFKLRGDWY